MEPRSQTEIAADIGGARKAVRIVDRGIEAQRADRPDAWYLQEASADVIFKGGPLEVAVEGALVVDQALAMIREEPQLRSERSGAARPTFVNLLEHRLAKLALE